MLKLARPKKRMTAALAIAAMGLFAVATLLATPGANGLVEIRVINGSGVVLPRVEVKTSDGERTFRDIPAGESRSFSVPAAATSRVRFECEGPEGASTATFRAMGGPDRGEYLQAVELRYALGQAQVMPKLGADFPTRVRYAFGAIRSRLGL